MAADYLAAVEAIPRYRKIGDAADASGDPATARRWYERAYELYRDLFGIADGDGILIAIDYLSALADAAEYDRLRAVAQECVAALPATDARRTLVRLITIVSHGPAAEPTPAEIDTILREFDEHITDLDPEDVAGNLANLAAAVASRLPESARMVAERVVEIIDSLPTVADHVTSAEIDETVSRALLMVGLAANRTGDLDVAWQRLVRAMRIDAGSALEEVLRLRLFVEVASVDCQLLDSGHSSVHAQRRLPYTERLVRHVLSRLDELSDGDRSALLHPLTGTVAVLGIRTGNPFYHRQIRTRLRPMATGSAGLPRDARLRILAEEAFSAAGPGELAAVAGYIDNRRADLDALFSGLPGRILRRVGGRSRAWRWSTGLLRRIAAWSRLDPGGDAGQDQRALEDAYVRAASEQWTEYTETRREWAWQMGWLLSIGLPLGLASQDFIVSWLLNKAVPPLDYRGTPLQILFVALLLVPIAAGLNRLYRWVDRRLGGPGPDVAFGPSGIELYGFGVPWPDVRGIDARRRGAARRIRLSLTGGRNRWLPTPRSYAWWRPDADFQRKLATLRYRARRYGAGVDAPHRHRPVATVALALAVLVSLTLVAVQGVRRGVVLPWDPTVRVLPALCALTDMVERDGRLSGVEVVGVVNGHSGPPGPEGSFDRQSCVWWVDGKDAMNVEIAAIRWPGNLLASPNATAISHWYALRRTYADPRPVGGLADGAFRAVDQDRLHVVCRRANVTVDVAVKLSYPAHTTANTEAVARGVGTIIADALRVE